MDRSPSHLVLQRNGSSPGRRDGEPHRLTHLLERLLVDLVAPPRPGGGLARLRSPRRPVGRGAAKARARRPKAGWARWAAGSARTASSSGRTRFRSIPAARVSATSCLASRTCAAGTPIASRSRVLIGTRFGARKDGMDRLKLPSRAVGAETLLDDAHRPRHTVGPCDLGRLAACSHGQSVLPTPALITLPPLTCFLSLSRTAW
jgi:hypothetical protein